MFVNRPNRIFATASNMVLVQRGFVRISTKLALNITGTTSLTLLPTNLKIFHGREDKLHELVHLLLQDPARVVILGPVRIGKTILAMAALDHPDVSARYPEHHFVSCESPMSHDDLVLIIVSHLGLAPSRNSSKHILRHFGCTPSICCSITSKPVGNPVTHEVKLRNSCPS